MNNVATIDKIRQAVRALRNSVEAKGQEGKSYNVAVGISFSPAKNLNADALIEAVNKNRTVSPNLVYGFQAGLKKDPMLGLNKQAAIDALSKFEKELSDLPQDASAAMVLEFTVSNPHEQEIVEDAQKTITALEQATIQSTPKLVKA